MYYLQGREGVSLLIAGPEEGQILGVVRRKLSGAAQGCGDRQGVLVLGFPAETEFGIKVQYRLVGEEEHAVALAGPVPEHLLHEALCQALSPAILPGHDSAQLDVPAVPAVQEHLQPVDGDVGKGGSLGQKCVGQVGGGPESALIPRLEGQAKYLPGQGVKALPEVRVRHPVFCNSNSISSPDFSY